ncbi:MAG: hypothetical protein PHC61_02620 [Chitinivibrionales bacterium]|nr:hypothetical protein [Chitinivibrionales bacterium]
MNTILQPTARPLAGGMRVNPSMMAPMGRPMMGGGHGNGHHPHYHTFCQQCCHPIADCCCGAPQCRKEAKELLVVPAANDVVTPKDPGIIRDTGLTMRMLAMIDAAPLDASAIDKKGQVINSEYGTITSGGIGKAFIGGGCCVHLSIEYALENSISNTAGKVSVRVVDSENTSLSWGKYVPAQSSYQIKENIITTYPGAQLAVAVSNVIARVRWCEVFSC